MAIKIIMGFLSVAAAVFAALQTYLKLPELAQNHSKAATDFGGLRRLVEKLEANPPTSDKLEAALAALDDEWGLVLTSPIYSRISSCGNKKSHEITRHYAQLFMAL